MLFLHFGLVVIVDEIHVDMQFVLLSFMRYGFLRDLCLLSGQFKSFIPVSFLVIDFHLLFCS